MGIFALWLKRTFLSSYLSKPARRRQRLSTVHLLVEDLEARLTPSAITVTDATDTAGSATDVTLRYAVNEANTDAANNISDTIAFDTTQMGTNTITLNRTLGSLELTAGPGVTTINGGGQITVSGNYFSGEGTTVFAVDGGAQDILSGLTITRGYAHEGAGIDNIGTLTLTYCNISGNHAYASGGGIYNQGTLNLSYDTLSGNAAGSDSGGILNVGAMTISESTICDNSAYNYAGVSSYGPATISNSTVADNVAAEKGGGIFTSGSAMTVINCTVSGNSAYEGGGIMCPSGGLTLESTIVAANTAGADIYGGITTDNGYNLLGTGVNSSGVGDIFTNSPLLAPLYNYGGPTETMALLPGSPAIGAGDPNQAGTTAQNGVIRPSTPDIGADQGVLLPVVTTNTGNLPNNAVEIVINGTYFNSNMADDSVSFNDGVSGTVVDATTTQLYVDLTNLNSVTAGTALDAIVTVNSVSSSSVQVATVQAAVTTNTCKLPNNTAGMVINGYFNTNIADDSVSFNDGVSGTVVDATTTQLYLDLINLSGVSAGTALDAVVIVNSVSSSDTQVATVQAAGTVPAVSSNAAGIADSSLTITVNGSGFDPNPANDAVLFNLGVQGTVASVNNTGTSMTVDITTLPEALGHLDALVVTEGLITSGSLVQVGTVVNGDWAVTDPNGNAGSGSPTDITLPYAVAHAQNGDTITFSSALSGDTITLNSVLSVNADVTICGGGQITVSGNNASGVFRVNSGPAELSGLTITEGNNSGISNFGTLALSDDMVTDNFGGGGGGISNFGTITINDTTIAGNTAGIGAGIYNVGTATVSNSTIYANTAMFSSGGGILNFGTLTLTSDTITDNAASAGGGISSEGDTVTMDNTIVADNYGGAPGPLSVTSQGSDIAGPFTANYCLIGNTSGATINGANNLLNVSAGLASALAYNGGPTQTLALLPGSLAIGAGDPNQAGITTDQRGFPLDSPNPDIGAFQTQAPPVISSIAPNSAQALAGAADFSITVNGSGFISSSIVQWNGAALTTAFDSTTQLSATVPGSDVGSAGVAYVTVVTSGGSSSNQMPFFITNAITTVLSSGTATSTDSAGTATASAGGTTGTPGSVSATATGSGTVTVAQYASDPSSTAFSAAGSSATAYFDVNATSSVSSLSIVDNNLPNGATTADWFNGSTWIPVDSSEQAYTPAADSASGVAYITITVTANSPSPNLSQLTGTYFAVVPIGLTITGDVYVLNQTASGALTVSGNAVLHVQGTLQVDSSSSSAVMLSGNAEVNAAQTLIVGGDHVSGHADLGSTVTTAAAYVSDPLAVLAAQAGSSAVAVNLSGSQTLTLNPGVYSSIIVSGSAHLTLAPGTYIIGSGGVTVSGNGIVTGGSAAAGVLIYNNGALTVSGNASVDLTAYSTGDYAGLAIFQARTDTSAVTVSGNANLNLNGSFLYDANAQSIVTISGNAHIEASLVVNELTISGNSDDSAQ